MRAAYWFRGLSVAVPILLAVSCGGSGTPATPLTEQLARSALGNAESMDNALAVATPDAIEVSGETVVVRYSMVNDNKLTEKLTSATRTSYLATRALLEHTNASTVAVVVRANINSANDPNTPITATLMNRAQVGAEDFDWKKLKERVGKDNKAFLCESTERFLLREIYERLDDKGCLRTSDAAAPAQLTGLVGELATTTTTSTTTTGVPKATTTAAPTTTKPRLDVAECNDGTRSDNTDFGNTCSSHKGVARWIADFGTCQDGTKIRMTAASNCDGHGPFAGLDAAYQPNPEDRRRLLRSVIGAKTSICANLADVTIAGATLTVTARSKEGFTEGGTKDAARLCTASILEGAQLYRLDSDLATVKVVITYDLVNALGEVTKDATVVTANYNTATVVRIVFDNIDKTKILTLAASKTVHPAFAKGDGS